MCARRTPLAAATPSIAQRPPRPPSPRRPLLLVPLALASFVTGPAHRPSHGVLPVAGRASDAMMSSAFGSKHAGKDLNMAFLEPVEVDPLARTGKIVATLGPASQSVEMLEALIAAGVDVFRLNSSHRRPGQFEELVPNIRRLAAAAGRDVKILGDIQGPKFRCSMTEGDVPIPLEKGQVVEFALATDDADATRAGRITLSPTTEQTALLRGLEPGMQVLLDDGFMEVRVKERVSADAVTAEVVIGGGLKSRKGINVPELQIDCSALTVKDREDATFLLTCPGGVDYIALSFAQKAGDIQASRRVATPSRG